MNADSAAVFAAALTGDRAAGQGQRVRVNAPAAVTGGDAGDAAALSRQAALHIDAKAETAAALAGDFTAVHCHAAVDKDAVATTALARDAAALYRYAAGVYIDAVVFGGGAADAAVAYCQVAENEDAVASQAAAGAADTAAVYRQAAGNVNAGAVGGCAADRAAVYRKIVLDIDAVAFALGGQAAVACEGQIALDFNAAVEGSAVAADGILANQLNGQRAVGVNAAAIVSGGDLRVIQRQGCAVPLDVVVVGACALCYDMPLASVVA